MNRQLRSLVLTATALLTLRCAPALAQADLPPDPLVAPAASAVPHSWMSRDLSFRTRDWSLELQPGVWFAATRGDVRLPGGSTFQAEDLNFDSVTPSPTLDARLRFGDWQVDASAAFFRYDDDARVSDDADLGDFLIARGDHLDVRLDYTHLHLRAGRRVWTADLTDSSQPAFDRDIAPHAAGINIDVELFGGIRYVDYDLRMKAETGAAAGQRVSVSESWFQPTFGAALRIDFENRLTFDVMANIGGWHDGSGSAFSLDVAASVGYALTNNVQLDAGYRYIHNSYDMGSDDFEVSGSVAGLFAAVTFRF
jgi:opacity protein-like surface antigen